MSKKSVSKRAFKMIWAYNPHYFPIKFFQTIFEKITPFFNLWLSSEIITALYENKEKKEIYLLVLITLCGNLLIRILNAYFTKSVTIQRDILNNNEAAAFNRKTLSLDYDKLENPDVRQHRRNIRENTYINRYGTAHLRLNIEELIGGFINFFFCLILFVEMISMIAKAPFHFLVILFLLALLGSIVINMITQARVAQKIAVNYKIIGDFMLDANRYGRGYSTAGMDNRIYKQQILLDRFFEKHNKKHYTVISSAILSDTILRIPVRIFSKCTELFSYLLVCFFCIQGVFPVGSVIKYVGYLGQISESISTIFRCFIQFKENEPFLQTYLDYFDISNDMYQGSLAVEKRSDKKYDISLRNVSFRYAGTEHDALKNINLDLKVGERLAVVGMNGSGKTTFIKLLCRLYDPTEGEIFMNDFNIRKYDYRQYLDLFSVVFQDFSLLPLPLGNVVAADATWDTQKAEQLLEEVGFGERYAQMLKKLDTPLYKEFDEDGVIVSGGEAQKIALARALYRDAPFIILDEPTAALDPIAEAEIYSKFNEIVGDKTAIYISHRLSSCRFCDKIAVFDQGEIVQVGTHEELLADENGKYYELWYAQAQYYQK